MNIKYNMIIASIMLVFIGCSDNEITNPGLSNNIKNLGAAFSPDGLRIAYIKVLSQAKCGNEKSAI